MTDLLTATQDAFVAALKTGMGDDFGPVLQHVPENTGPPLIVVGRIEAIDYDGKQTGVEQHTVEVVYSYRGNQRWRLYAMMHAGRTSLEGAGLWATGAIFGRPAWQSSETDIDEDGVTYQGVQTFTTLVQSA